MRTLETTVTVLENETEVKRFLLAVGVKAPTLHPRAASPHTRDRWNGWNYTKTMGVDADNHFVVIEAWHFASGHTDHSVALNGGTGRLSTGAFAGINWPIQVFPAIPIIQYPEYTPTEKGEPDDHDA
jgi:hypothetical protein